LLELILNNLFEQFALRLLNSNKDNPNDNEIDLKNIIFNFLF
jgi:hypothetical protein